ncbi:hypothetical protein IWX50DRAFT_275880 [Phyllosticta citricarpa]
MFTLHFISRSSLLSSLLSLLSFLLSPFSFSSLPSIRHSSSAKKTIPIQVARKRKVARKKRNEKQAKEMKTKSFRCSRVCSFVRRQNSYQGYRRV